MNKFLNLCTSKQSSLFSRAPKRSFFENLSGSRFLIGMEYDSLIKINQQMMKNSQNGVSQKFMNISELEKASLLQSYGIAQIINYFNNRSDSVSDDQHLSSLSYDNLDKYFSAVSSISKLSIYDPHFITGFNQRVPSLSDVDFWRIADSLSYFVALVDDLSELQVSSGEYENFMNYLTRTGNVLIEYFCVKGKNCDALDELLAELSTDGSLFQNEHFHFFIDLMMKLIHWVNHDHQSKMDKSVSITWLKRFLLVLCELIDGSKIEYDIYSTKSATGIDLTDYFNYRSKTIDMEMHFVFLGLMNNLCIDDDMFEDVCLPTSHKKIGILVGVFNDLFAINKDIDGLNKLRLKCDGQVTETLQMFEKRLFVNQTLLNDNVFVNYAEEATHYVDCIGSVCGTRDNKYYHDWLVYHELLLNSAYGMNMWQMISKRYAPYREFDILDILAKN